MTPKVRGGSVADKGGLAVSWAKRIGIATLLGLVCVAAVFIWYQAYYSMNTARPFTVGVATAQSRVLIASQGSEFKNAVVQGVIASLRDHRAYVQVIDVTGLDQVDAQDWDVVVILHTWENFQPQADASAFVARLPIPNNAVVLATSSAADLKIEGVDSIATASRMTDVALCVAELNKRIDTLLAAKSPQVQ